MANRLRLRFTGLKELASAMDAYGKAVVADAQKAVADTVQEVTSCPHRCRLESTRND